MNFSFEHVVIAALVVYNIVREIFYQYTVQKLINKLMSRDFQEYKYVNESRPPEFKPPRIDEGIPEDFGSLAGIG